MSGPDRPVIDFSAYVAERTRGFDGRNWVFQAIDRWLADAAGAPLFLLTGEPGAGKSAIAGRLALISSGAVPASEGTGRLRPGFLSAVHFCSARDRRWINPQVFAESLAQQFSDRYASYALALLESVAPMINVRQEVRENWGRMVAAEIGTLVVTASPEDLFDRIVREPLEVLARDQLNDPVTVLVDALDESLAYTGNITIADLVTQAEDLPDAVRFIVTCRPKSELMRNLQLRSPQQYTLSPRLTQTDGPPDAYARVLRDVQDHVERVMRDEAPALSDRLAANLAPQHFVAMIRDNSEGNFLYVRYVLQMMLDRQEPITPESLAAAPAGLDAIYLEFVQRLVPAGVQAWHSEYGKVLGVLAVGQVPLTEDQIANFTALPPTATRVALRKMRELLEADESRPASQRVYSLYHRSLADFLLDRDRAEEYWLDDVSMHQLVTAYYWASRTAGWRTCDEYGMRYLATHLFAGREIARLQSLVDEDWIRMRYERGRYSYDGVLDDVELAWRAAEQSNRIQIANGAPATYVAQDVRWALTISSIGSLAAGIPADLLGVLVRRGEWSPLQGLAYARRVPEGEPRSKTLASLAAQLPEPLRSDVFAESIAAARQIPDPEQRARGLTWLLPRLPRDPRTETLIQAMAAVRELTDRRRIAGGNTGHYGGGIGERYQDTGVRTKALAELGEILAGLSGPGLDQTEIVEHLAGVCAESDDRFLGAAEAVAARLTGGPGAIPADQLEPWPDPPLLADITARISIGDADQRAEFAATFAAPTSTDPGDHLTAQVAAVREAPCPYYQSATLSALAPHLPVAVLADALDVAQAIRDPDPRARAMSGLAPYLPEPLLRSVLSRVGPDSRGVAFTLAPLAGYLPDPLLREAFTRAADIDDDFERAGVLAVLAPHLAEPLTSEALAFVRRVIARPADYEHQDAQDALARLVLYLPEAVAVGFDKIPIADRWDQPAEHFALDLARRAPASMEAQQRLAALAKRAISGAKNATHPGRSYASWNLRSQISRLIGLLPHLPEPYLTEAAAAAVRLIVDESAEMLYQHEGAMLGTYLPKELLPDAEAATALAPGLPSFLPDDLVVAALDVARRKRNVHWLFALTPRLDRSVLPEALRIAHELGGAALQAQLMADCPEVFARLAPEVLYSAWSDTLRGMANLNRAVCLRNLQKFGPVVAALAGPATIEEVRQAVAEVERLWP